MSVSGADKAPSSDPSTTLRARGGSYKGEANPRGRGKPLPYKGRRGHLKVAATGRTVKVLYAS